MAIGVIAAIALTRIDLSLPLGAAMLPITLVGGGAVIVFRRHVVACVPASVVGRTRLHAAGGVCDDGARGIPGDSRGRARSDSLLEC